MSRHVAIQVLERQADFLQSIEEAGQCQWVERGTDDCVSAETSRAGDAVLPSISSGTPALHLPAFAHFTSTYTTYHIPRHWSLASRRLIQRRYSRHPTHAAPAICTHVLELLTGSCRPGSC